jgi:molybdopterin converting factor small subunit
MNDTRIGPAERPAAMRVRLRLFGALRDAACGDELTLDVPAGTTVASLRSYVKDALARAAPGRRHDQLVELSALASDRAILAESHLLAAADASLCILPPVCGG